MEDLSIKQGDKGLNIRTGAIIIKDGRMLLIWSPHGEHWYSVGGRVKFGESSIEAVRRELKEELGDFAERLTGGELVVVNENFFQYGEHYVHEYGFYYLFDGSALPEAEEIPLGDCNGYLKYLTEEELKREVVYPLFLKDGLKFDGVKHIIIRE